MSPHVRWSRAAGAVVLVVAVALTAPSVVFADADLVSTTPEAGSTVEGTPTVIEAIFDEPLSQESTSLSLRDPDGNEVAKGGLDPADPTRIVITDVPELLPGEYEVRWTILSEDGHISRDTWTFTVVPAPTPSPSPTPSPTVAPSATVAPTPSPTVVPTPTVAPSPSGDGGSQTGDGSDAILPIIIALALVAVVGGFLLTRRGRTTPPA